MQTETLNQIKRQIVLLDDNSKHDLAEFLAEELKSQNEKVYSESSEDERNRQLNWLKENREKYAGKYVALVGDKLVGEGKTLREANEKAKENGAENFFITFVYSENDIPFGGW